MIQPMPYPSGGWCTPGMFLAAELGEKGSSVSINPVIAEAATVATPTFFRPDPTVLRE